MKFAVIETGGQQFIVKPGDKIKLHLTTGENGKAIIFDKVLLTANGDSIEIGKPYLTGAKVEGKVAKQGRDRKVLVMKYHNKTRYRRKRGHRQDFTEIEITNV